MIGRGALGAPWIFAPTDMTREDKARTIRRHCQLIETHLPPRVAPIQLKKHLAWYTNGLPFAAQARLAIFEAPDADHAQALFWQRWGGDDPEVLRRLRHR